MLQRTLLLLQMIITIANSIRRYAAYVCIDSDTATIKFLFTSETPQGVCNNESADASSRRVRKEERERGKASLVRFSESGCVELFSRSIGFQPKS